MVILTVSESTDEQRLAEIAESGRPDKINDRRETTVMISRKNTQ